jgi:3-deoxy-manno-octulosonate cytidylyltransferase (CMP-KDO synthetase)
MKIGIIPARYAASRLPGKPLRMIGPKSMIQWVYEGACASALDRVIVATDHPEIFAHVQGFGGAVAMTDPDHPSGTDRCAEVARQYTEATWIVNIQGDEPFVSPEHINRLLALADSPADIATLVTPIQSREELQDPNVVKAVFSPGSGRALYFSRAAIPFNRDEPQAPELPESTYYRHLGMYAYRSTILPKLAELPVGLYERTERLEQLRWLEAGYRIYVSQADQAGLGVDTEADLERARQIVDKNLGQRTNRSAE